MIQPLIQPAKKISNTLFQRLRRTIMRAVPKDGSLVREDQMIRTVPYDASEVISRLHEEGMIEPHMVVGKRYWGRVEVRL